MTFESALWVASFALVAALSYAGVSRMIVLAIRKGIVDVPVARSSHAAPTPLGGGAPIVLLTCAGSAAAWWLYAGARSPKSGALLLLAALALGAVSWIDDLRGLSTRLRGSVHLAAAAAAVAALGPFSVIRLPVAGVVTASSAVAGVLTLAWIVGLTNAYNFMDGIDGIAALQAVIAGAGWSAIALAIHDELTAAISLLITAASLGFLFQNWAPASIFMGDVSSAFLGFSFAVIPLLWHGDRSKAPLIGFLMVWPFVVDAFFTFLRRLWLGERVFEPHRSHIYQRLCATGWSHALVATVYGFLDAAGVALAISYQLDVIGQSVAITSVLILATFLWGMTVQREQDSRFA
jgi:UDP-N-acetylmuramyl pentapeptide phosphotransferase/UDP-N-acetylglucosamine-1-phosphate transferase